MINTMEWIKFIEGDYDTYPMHSGNWDDTSKDVVDCYLVDGYKTKKYGCGYTDWDGDNHYWNIKGEKRPIEVLAWSYFKDYTD